MTVRHVRPLQRFADKQKRPKAGFETACSTHIHPNWWVQKAGSAMLPIKKLNQQHPTMEHFIEHFIVQWKDHKVVVLAFAISASRDGKLCRRYWFHS
jgi:hypothetical protein